MTTPAEAFAAWCAFLDTVEGTTLSTDRLDSGNWTGGVVGQGTFGGSKGGIAASSHPDLNIAALTPGAINELRKPYWAAVRGDELPGPVAFVLAEGAYGSGQATAIKQMQAVVGMALRDGVFGAQTMTALTKALGPNGIQGFIVEYEAQRLLYEASLTTWPTYRVGWTRRMFSGTAHALSLAGAPLPGVVVITPPIATAPVPLPPTVDPVVLAEGIGWRASVTSQIAALAARVEVLETDALNADEQDHIHSEAGT